jgi:chemotaxis protein methyltransferase CheR
MVFFREHNLFNRPPLFFVDAIFCRNVRIYFNRQEADSLLGNLYKSLNEDGFLILGESEALPVSLKNKFSRCKKPYKIFQKHN